MEKIAGKGWLKGWLSRIKIFRGRLLDGLYTRTLGRIHVSCVGITDPHSKAPTCIIPRHDLANGEKASDALVVYYAAAFHVRGRLVGSVMKPINDEEGSIPAV